MADIPLPDNWPEDVGCEIGADDKVELWVIGDVAGATGFTYLTPSQAAAVGSRLIAHSMTLTIRKMMARRV